MWKMPWYDITYLFKAYSDYVNEEDAQNEKQRVQMEAEQADARSDMSNFNSSAINSEITNVKNSMMSQIPKF